MTAIDTLRQAAVQFAAEAASFGNPITCVLLVGTNGSLMQSISFPKDKAELVAAVLGLDEMLDQEIGNLFPPPPKPARAARAAKKPARK